jgi:hypothetical protein
MAGRSLTGDRSTLGAVFRSVFLALLLALAMSLPTTFPALAADPTPAASPIASPVLVDPLDPRAGEGASRVGAPFLALVVVIAIGVIAAGATFAYVRLTRRA